MKILYLKKRWQHHTASGGYDRLEREVDGGVVARYEVSGFWHRAARLWWRQQSHTEEYLIDYRYEDWLAELSLLVKSRIRRPDVVHVLYGDEQLDLLLRRRWMLPCPLMVTFHVPTCRVTSRFEKIQKHLLLGIDAAVVVSRYQLQDFSHWLGADRVVYIPHGIDIQRFCPGERDLHRRQLRLITVGHHMRDWEALHRIIDECNARQLVVQFDVVAPKPYWPFLAGCVNTRLHANIAEDDFIKLYQDADVLLLPIVDATANNALLESLACGTPVISSAVGGIPDYVDDACSWLFKRGEVTEIVELVEQICRDRTILLSMREAARRKSLEFSWQRIAGQMRAVYSAVIGRRSPVGAVGAREQKPNVVRTAHQHE